MLAILTCLSAVLLGDYALAIGKSVRRWPDRHHGYRKRYGKIASGNRRVRRLHPDRRATIIAHGSQGNQGIGFAIPVNMARNGGDRLVKNGKVTRSYLGIVPQDVTPAIAKAFGEKEPNIALVGDVSANSRAQRGGRRVTSSGR